MQKKQRTISWAKKINLSLNNIQVQFMTRQFRFPSCIQHSINDLYLTTPTSKLSKQLLKIPNGLPVLGHCAHFDARRPSTVQCHTDLRRGNIASFHHGCHLEKARQKDPGIS